MKLSYGAYTFTITPIVNNRVAETEYDDAGNRKGQKETWTISGYLKAAGEAAINALSDTFEAAVNQDAQDLKLTNDAQDTVYESLLAANCYKGPKVTQWSFPHTGEKAEWATNRPFSITVEGTLPVATGFAGIVMWERRTVYSHDQHDKLTITTSGTVETDGGTSARAKAAVEDPAGPAPVKPAGYNRMSRSFDTNRDDTECRFNFVDVEPWAAWPADVTGGSYIVRWEMSGNARMTKTFSGSFAGLGAADAYMLLRLTFKPDQGSIIAETAGQNDFTGTFDFNISWEMPFNTDGYLEFEETITFRDAFIFSTYHYLTNTVLKEKTHKVGVRITQSGRAVRIGQRPVVPAAVRPQDLTGPKEESQRIIKGGIDGATYLVRADANDNPTDIDVTPEQWIDRKFESTWRYEMEATGVVAVPDPLTQPHNNLNVIEL